MSGRDWSELSLLEMFRLEVQDRAATMTASLLRLEREAPTAPVLEELMRRLQGNRVVPVLEEKVELAKDLGEVRSIDLVDDEDEG